MHIRPLSPEDAPELAVRLTADGPEYTRHFQPFPFDAISLRKTICQVKRDRFWGIFVDSALAGFFMLRGFDAGFLIPSYGVYISKPFSRKGLSTFALQFVLSWCRLQSIRTLMLKCHPGNRRALKLYRAYGFEERGIDPTNDNLIFHKILVA